MRFHNKLMHEAAPTLRSTRRIKYEEMRHQEPRVSSKIIPINNGLSFSSPIIIKLLLLRAGSWFCILEAKKCSQQWWCVVYNFIHADILYGIRGTDGEGSQVKWESFSTHGHLGLTIIMFLLFKLMMPERKHVKEKRTPK